MPKPKTQLRRPPSKSPMELSLDYMRKMGYFCEITERWQQFPGTKKGYRKDLLGFADIICLRQGEIVLVQTTTENHVQERVDKIAGLFTPEIWKRAGGHIVVHGWGDKGLKEVWF